MGWLIGTSIFLGCSLLAYFLIGYKQQEHENGETKWVKVCEPSWPQIWTIAKIFIFIVCFIFFIATCGDRERVHQESMKKVRDSYNRNYR